MKRRHLIYRIAALALLIFTCAIPPAKPALSAPEKPDTIRVAFNCSVKPYHFLDERGNPVGLHIDMMNWIAEEKGLDIVYVPYEKNGACIEALRTGLADVVLGHRTNDTAAADLQYTGELSSSWLCLVARSDKAQQIKRAGSYQHFSSVIEYGLTANLYLTKMGINRYLTKGNPTAVFDALVEGKVDMALVVNDCYQYQLHEANLEGSYEVLRSYVAPVSYAMLMRRNDTELFATLDAALTEMRAGGSYESFYNKWIVKTQTDINSELIERIWRIAGSIILIAAVIAVFSFTMNRILKRKVREQTKELCDANIELDRQMIHLQSEISIRSGIIENSPCGMLSFGSDLRVKLMNWAAVKLTGVQGDGVGADARDLPIFGDILARIDYDMFSLASYEDGKSHPVTIELSDRGVVNTYRYNIYCLRNEQGISEVLLTVENVTAEEQEKQALFEKEKNRTLGGLVAGIAHEIKNPLMSIRTASSLLKNQWNDPGVRDAFVRFVPDEVDRINQLIEGLINYARPVKGERAAVFLDEVVSECLYLAEIASKKMELRYNLDLDKTAVVLANRDRIKQTVINIIINGIESIQRKPRQAQDDPPEMDIRVMQDGEYAYIIIRDEGIGMSAEEIERCTEPFFTTKAAGTGLGLALAQQFMQENRGQLLIRSALTKYTEITLKFRRFQPNA